ncbi:MAG: hypothetical protein ACREPY_18595, partial [Rhodanobacteraceae bacterium]
MRATAVYLRLPEMACDTQKSDSDSGIRWFESIRGCQFFFAIVPDRSLHDQASKAKLFRPLRIPKEPSRAKVPLCDAGAQQAERAR